MLTLLQLFTYLRRKCRLQLIESMYNTSAFIQLYSMCYNTCARMNLYKKYVYVMYVHTCAVHIRTYNILYEIHNTKLNHFNLFASI